MSSRHLRFPLLVMIVLVAAIVRPGAAPGASPIASALPGAADALIRTGLKDLHDGLYGRAEERFREAAHAAPGDPAPSLFIAFTSWWRLIQDRSDRTWDDAFLAAAASTVESGEAGLETSPGDERLLTCVGTAHILRSQVEGLRRNFFKASQEARRGKKMLEAALASDPSNRDALFGLGAYNYYTEKIPGLARGLLFMPRGNAELGLEQLKTVAASDAYFSTDARLLLALMCGSRDEQCYNDALEHLKLALAAVPGSPLLLGSIGGVKMRLGYYDEAARAFDQALAAAAGPGTERGEQRRSLRLYLAESLAAGWRLDRARSVLREALDTGGVPAKRDRQLADRIAIEIQQKAGETRIAGTVPAANRGKGADGTEPEHPSSLASQVRGALTALESGQDKEAIALLGAAMKAHPGDPLPHFLAGKAHFERNRFVDADREFVEAQRLAVDPPPWLAGWLELYRGLALRARGLHPAAQEHFRAASEVRRFRSAERALLELQGGAAPHKRCRP